MCAVSGTLAGSFHMPKNDMNQSNSMMRVDVEEYLIANGAHLDMQDDVRDHTCVGVPVCVRENKCSRLFCVFIFSGIAYRAPTPICIVASQFSVCFVRPFHWLSVWRNSFDKSV
jgi:hypothetical protein